MCTFLGCVQYFVAAIDLSLIKLHILGYLRKRGMTDEDIEQISMLFPFTHLQFCRILDFHEWHRKPGEDFISMEAVMGSKFFKYNPFRLRIQSVFSFVCFLIFQNTFDVVIGMDFVNFILSDCCFLFVYCLPESCVIRINIEPIDLYLFV